jgi:hypothetical protein
VGLIGAERGENDIWILSVTSSVLVVRWCHESGSSVLPLGPPLASYEFAIFSSILSLVGGAMANFVLAPRCGWLIDE